MKNISASNRYLLDKAERNRCKFHSTLAIPIPKNKKEAHRLRAIVRRIETRGEK